MGYARGSLEAKSVSAGYEGRPVIEGASIRVCPGEIVGIIGHNGAGKSTLLKGLVGMIPLLGGEVWLDGARVTPKPQAMSRRGVVYLPQGGRLFRNLSVEDNLRLSGVDLGKDSQHKRVQELFGEVELWLGKKGRELSGGQAQIVAVVGALASGRRLVLFDEPSLGLAPGAVEQLFSFLQRQCEDGSVGLMIAEHRLGWVLQVASRVAVVRRGRVVYEVEDVGPEDEPEIQKAFF